MAMRNISMRALNCTGGGANCNTDQSQGSSPPRSPMTPCTSRHVIHHNYEGVPRPNMNMDIEMGAGTSGTTASSRTITASNNSGNERRNTGMAPITPSPKKSINRSHNNFNTPKRVSSILTNNVNSISNITRENPLMKRIVSKTTKLMEVVNCAYAMRQLEDEWLQDAEDNIAQSDQICEAEQLWLEQQRQRMSQATQEDANPSERRTESAMSPPRPLQMRQSHREESSGTTQATRGNHAHVPAGAGASVGAHGLTDGHQQFYKAFFAVDNDEDYADSQFMRRSFASGASTTPSYYPNFR